MKDTLVILSTFADRNRFATDPNLRDIMTGVKADNAVNVDRIRATEERILSSMTRVSKLSVLLKSLLPALKATKCRYIRNSCF